MNIGKMMKNLQKMQSKLQAEMDSLEVEASAGGGVITARMNGKKELLSLKLAPEAITPDDAELMEDLVVAAVNECGRKVDEKLAELTQGMTGGACSASTTSTASMSVSGFPCQEDNFVTVISNDSKLGIHVSCNDSYYNAQKL